jgi:deoxyribose-phosphate aldolase
MIKKISELTPGDIASVCDHTYLDRPEAFRGKAENPVTAWGEDFSKFLLEMVGGKLIPYAVCVRPETVDCTKKFLDHVNKTNIKIASVAGFPHCVYDTETKIEEAVKAIENGADEIDFVLNYAALNDGDFDYVMEEIRQMGIFEGGGTLTKLILETSELSLEQIAWVSGLADIHGIDFIKTSTGFSSAGAKAEHLRIMKKKFSRGIKMSGGVNEKNVYELLEAASGRNDGYIDLDPLKIRIGESSLLKKIIGMQSSKTY